MMLRGWLRTFCSITLPRHHRYSGTTTPVHSLHFVSLLPAHYILILTPPHSPQPTAHDTCSHLPPPIKHLPALVS